MAKINKPTHITYGSVLDDLGFSPEQAAVLKMKAEMHSALLRRAKKYTQKELQEILKEPQPRVSEFLNGKIASVSIEKMAVYALRLGANPTIKLKSVRKYGAGLAARKSKAKTFLAAKAKRLASVSAS